MPQAKDKDWLNGYRNKTPIYAVYKRPTSVPGDIKGETCSAKQHLDPHRNGETKADDSSNKEAEEEKQEEDGDYHRSDESWTFYAMRRSLARTIHSNLSS